MFVERAAQMISEWISVEESLPDLDLIVLACWPSRNNGRPVYSFAARMSNSLGDHGWIWSIPNSSCTILFDEGAHNNSFEADDDYPVTHWRHLPKPPWRKFFRAME